MARDKCRCRISMVDIGVMGLGKTIHEI